MTRELVGFAFPFRIAPIRERLPAEDPGAPLPNGVARAAGSEKVGDDLQHLLSTRRGERTMLRAYGGGVHRRLQGPNDATLRALIRHDIEQSLRRFMPEVELTSPLQMTAREEELRIVIDYRARPGDVVRRLELELG